jgi:hypothetical protein
MKMQARGAEVPAVLPAFSLVEPVPAADADLDGGGQPMSDSDVGQISKLRANRAPILLKNAYPE